MALFEIKKAGGLKLQKKKRKNKKNEKNKKQRRKQSWCAGLSCKKGTN